MMRTASKRDSLGTVGEFGLIRQLQRQWPTSSPRVLKSIGDDAAILKTLQGQQLLLSTDTFVEGVHFDRAFQTLRDVGFRVGVANLSDIAAMGGQPLYLLVSIAIPASVPVQHIRILYRGIREACDSHRVALIGGDTSSSPRDIFLNLTIIGAIPSNRALTRSGAHVGDHLYVTGTLGDAHAGLHILQTRARHHQQSRLSVPEKFLTQRHLRPTPRIGIGRILATRGMAHAAIDLSDGLSGDVGHICDNSQVGVEIWANAVPLSPHLHTFARNNHLDPVAFALSGGDDYELLFTARAGYHDNVMGLSRRTGVPIAWIGEIKPKQFGQRLTLPQGRTRTLLQKSYRHFVA